jgi:hypothetical protein
MLALAAFFFIYLTWAVVSLWAWRQVRGFIDATPSIADEECLNRYKRMVRAQMYLALWVIVWLGLGMLAGIGVIASHGLPGLLFVVLVNGVVIAVSLFYRRAELRCRSRPAATESLAAEYRRVSEAWVKKPLPNF